MEERQVIHVPFSAGLDTKSDPRAVSPPKLTMGRDIQFELLGGIGTRKPFGAIGTNVQGGGTLSNYRRIYDNNGELVCLTVDTLYSWDSRDSLWVPRGTHLAVATTEQTRFATTDDQFGSDRAELNGTVVWAWVNGTNAYVAAMDKATGAVICPPTAFLGCPYLIRVVACQTRIMLVYELAIGYVYAIAIDPANVASSLAASPTEITGLNSPANFDVTQVIGADAIVGAVEVGSGPIDYIVFTCTSAMSVATSSKSRVAQGPIAVSCTPDGVHVQIARCNLAGNAIQGDLITIATLADVYTNQTLMNTSTYAIPGGGAVFSIAMAHRAVQNGGHYRCYYWIGISNSSTSAYGMYTGYVDDSGTIVVANRFNNYWLAPASRAFAYNQNVFFWAVFAESSDTGTPSASFASAVQNTYFLIRDDGFIAAVAATTVAGGHAYGGTLPGVQLTNGSTTFSWAGGIRRLVPITPLLTVAQQGLDRDPGISPTRSTYAERAPREIVFNFDDNNARRAVRIGSTLYFAGGENLQYDGQQLTELGFHVYPWTFTLTDVGSGGTLPSAWTGAYKVTWGWQNAAGDVDRSTTASVQQPTAGSSSDSFSCSVAGSLIPTHKTASVPFAEWWRTQTAPINTSPFYLVSSLNPQSTSTPNNFVPNTTLSTASPPSAATAQQTQYLAEFIDGENDATIATSQTNPENGGVLANICPPSASMICADQFRVYLGGVAGQPNTIWYSLQRNDGEVARFNDALVITVPPIGGALTGVIYHPQANQIIAFRQRAVYAFAGTGYDNLGNGSNFGPAQVVSTDVGCDNPDAFCAGPFGVIFHSAKGWTKLDGGLNLQYIGKGAAAFDGDTVYSVAVMESQNEVRIVTNNRIIVWDYLVDAWLEWTVATGVHATLWNGQYVYLDSSQGPMLEQTSYASGVNYGMDVELSFEKPAGYVGRFNTRWVMLLGEYRSSCLARVRVNSNYQQDGAGNWVYFDDVVKAPAAVVGGPLQVRHGPSQPNGMESLKVRITAISATLASIALTASGTTITITSSIGTSAGNALSLAHASATTLSAADSGGNLTTLSGPSTLTAQQMVDVLTRDSLLVSAAITAGSGSTVFNLSAFTGSLTGGEDWPTGEAMRLTALGLELGGAPGLFKQLAAAQEQ